MTSCFLDRGRLVDTVVPQVYPFVGCADRMVCGRQRTIGGKGMWVIFFYDYFSFSSGYVYLKILSLQSQYFHLLDTSGSLGLH